MSAALGELVAVFTLGGLGGWFRQRAASQQREKPEWTSTPRHLALALEQVAFVGSLVVAGLVALAASRPAMAASGLALASIGTLLALSLFYLLLTGRWNAEWLVYLAQASLVGAYVDYHLANPLTAAADAAVLVLFAFVDLGIAEVMERLQLPLFARPTRYASLILPVLPLSGSRARRPERCHRVSLGRGRYILCGRVRHDAVENARLRSRRSLQRRPLGALGTRWAGCLPTIPSSTLCRSGSRPSSSPSPTAASWAGSCQRDSIGWPDHHLPGAGRPDLAVSQFRRLGGPAAGLATGPLRRHRPAHPDVRLAGSGDLPG